MVNEMKRNDVNKCVDDLKKLNGLPPYDGGSNFVRNDGWFARSIEQDYDRATRDEAEKLIAELSREWQAARARFMR